LKRDYSVGIPTQYIHVSMPGVARDVADEILHTADEMCPYSKATRGNIDVAISLV
jgi:organic hydroperoxide reductase OsmC/OhrA